MPNHVTPKTSVAVRKTSSAILFSIVQKAKATIRKKRGIPAIPAKSDGTMIVSRCQMRKVHHATFAAVLLLLAIGSIGSVVAYSDDEDAPTYSPSTWYPSYSPTLKSDPTSSSVDNGEGHEADGGYNIYESKIMPVMEKVESDPTEPSSSADEEEDYGGYEEYEASKVAYPESFEWKDDGHDHSSDSSASEDWDDDGWDNGWSPSAFKKCYVPEKSTTSWSAPSWSAPSWSAPSWSAPSWSAPSWSASWSSAKSGKSGSGVKSGKSGSGAKSGKSGSAAKSGKSGYWSSGKSGKLGSPNSTSSWTAPSYDYIWSSPPRWSYPGLTPDVWQSPDSSVLHYDWGGSTKSGKSGGGITGTKSGKSGGTAGRFLRSSGFSGKPISRSLLWPFSWSGWRAGPEAEPSHTNVWSGSDHNSGSSWSASSISSIDEWHSGKSFKSGYGKSGKSGSGSGHGSGKSGKSGSGGKSGKSGSGHWSGKSGKSGYFSGKGSKTQPGKAGKGSSKSSKSSSSKSSKSLPSNAPTICYKPERIITPPPTKAPTRPPTYRPTRFPTRYPTKAPTIRPTRHPSYRPTYRPTMEPTKSPTMNPTRYPTKRPTYRPTKSPTPKPTLPPTYRPTKSPTPKPSSPPTYRPTRSPTHNPVTPAPTTCQEAYSTWHYVPALGTMANVCTNLPISSNLGFDEYDSSADCCDEQFPDGGCRKFDYCDPAPLPTPPPTFPPTESPTKMPTKRPTKSPTISPTKSPVTPAPTTCEEANPAWYYISDLGDVTDACTNIPIGNENLGFVEYDSSADCCDEHFPNESCRIFDICDPAPLPTFNPTSSPTMGSTPTVDIDTTVPPTHVGRESTTDTDQIGSNDFQFLTHTKRVKKDCVENYNRVWSMESMRIVNRCVYICTETTNIFEGDELWQTETRTFQDNCPGRGN